MFSSEKNTSEARLITSHEQRQDHDRTGLQRRQREPDGTSGLNVDRTLVRSGAC